MDKFLNTLYLSKIEKETYIMLKKLLILLLMLPTVIFAQNSPEQEAIISVERIWDRAQHNAFTSLIFHNNKFYCSFREGSGHTPGINGTIRIIASDDGQNWYSMAHLNVADVDLRDPQLSVTPDNRIMLNIGGSVYSGGELIKMQPMVSFSDKTGRNFSSPQNIKVDDKIKTDEDWLWKVTWHKGTAYSAIYQPTTEGSILQLVKSSDGIIYSYITTLKIPGQPNETTLRFTSEGKMTAVVRRGGNNPHGYIGVSDLPYKKWKWNELEGRLGGPDFLILPNNKMICGTREYLSDGENKMILAKITNAGDLTKLVTLPSEGDCSYPGMVIKDNILYISYYSTHEGKTTIYLAKMRFEKLENWLKIETTSAL